MTRGNSPRAQLELLNLLKMSRLTNYLDSLSVLKKDSKTTSSKYYSFKGCIIRVSDHVTFKASCLSIIIPKIIINCILFNI